MATRRPLLMSITSFILKLLSLASGAYTTAVSADIHHVRPAPGFSYHTGRITTLDLSLADTGGAPALLSIYTKGTHGLRLLHNALTDAHGHYVGDLRLPAHIDEVVVVVRAGGRQETLTLPVEDQHIVYAE